MSIIAAPATRLQSIDTSSDDGFQTAEAIGIAAVGVIVLVAIAGALQLLGLDVIDWMRDSLGIGS